jgi:transcriptional regulator of arginine metabolism
MMVVLLTESGKAGDVAQAIDRLSLPDVLGTVAGQDTVFIATSSPGQALDLCRHLSRWATDRI